MRPVTGAGNIRQGPAQAPVQGPEPVRSAESSQPGRSAYPSVSQERRNLLELRESPFIPHSRRSSVCNSRCTLARSAQRASVSHAASTLLMTGGWISSTPSLSRTISEWQPKRQQHNQIVRVSINGDSFWRLEHLDTRRNLPSC